MSLKLTSSKLKEQSDIGTAVAICTKVVIEANELLKRMKLYEQSTQDCETASARLGEFISLADGAASLARGITCNELKRDTAGVLSALSELIVQRCVASVEPEAPVPESSPPVAPPSPPQTPPEEIEPPPVVEEPPAEPSPPETPPQEVEPPVGSADCVAAGIRMAEINAELLEFANSGDASGSCPRVHELMCEAMSLAGQFCVVENRVIKFDSCFCEEMNVQIETYSNLIFQIRGCSRLPKCGATAGRGVQVTDRSSV